MSAKTFVNFVFDQSIVSRVSSTTFIANELTKNISDPLASDRLVALRGYVPARRKARIWLRRRDESGAAEFRERRHNQGGEQVVHDLTIDHRI